MAARLACLLALTPALVFCQAPRIFYTDLISAPKTGGQNNNGAFITLYGQRFGSTQAGGSITVGGAAVAAYPVWTDTKVTIQLGASAASGNLVLTNANGVSNGIPFTIAPGNIYFVATTGSDGANGSYSSPWRSLTYARDTIAPGDIVYAMNGVAQTSDDNQGWSSCLTIGANSGSPGALKAMVVYPGASATIGNVNSNSAGGCDSGIRAKGQGESYWAFAGFTIRGGAVGMNPNFETGWRIVANDISCPNGNAQAGCLDLGTETTLAVYGNNIHHVGTNLKPGDVTALYHGVYISEFNHGVDFGWNTIAYVQGCRGLQQNVNEGSSSYDLHIHDNIIHDTQCDGIVMTTVDPSKGTVELYNNLIYNAGTGPANAENSGAWNCIYVRGDDPNGYGPGSGVVDVYNNTLYDCGNWTHTPYGESEGTLLWANAGNTNKSLRLRNNIIYASTVSPYCDDTVCNGITGSNNIFYGNGAPPSNSRITASINADPKLTSLSLSSPDFHLQPGSPAINAGVSIAGLATDFDGIPRAQDIGAYQFIVRITTSSMTLAASPASLAFGTVNLSQNSTLLTTITNTGNSAVTISAASINATAFSITTQPSYPYVLAPNAAAQYSITFAPATIGTASAVFSISSNATNSPTTISLSGMGGATTMTLTASPATLAFGSVTTSQSSTLTTTITNTGTSRVTLDSASIISPHARVLRPGRIPTSRQPGFSIVSQPSYPYVLNPNASAQFTVKLSPASTGAADATLTVKSDATNSPTTISLNGSGVAPGVISAGKKGSNGTGSSGTTDAINVLWNGGGSTAGADAILVVVYASNGPYTASNITDTAGNIYHLDATIAHPHTGEIYVFSCLRAAAASSVKVTPPSFGLFQIVTLEYHGLLAAGALDKAGTMHDDGFQGSSGTYNWSANPSGPLTQATELVLVMNADAYANVTGYIAAGYTQEILQAGSVGVLDAVVSSTNSVTPSGTYTASGGTWVASFLMTYK